MVTVKAPVKTTYTIVHPAADIATKLASVNCIKKHKKNGVQIANKQIMDAFVMPVRRNNHQIRKMLDDAAARNVKLTFTGKCRLFDIVGSSNDLPQWQTIFSSLPQINSGMDYNDPFGVWGSGMPTLSASCSTFPVPMNVTPAERANIIEVESADYDLKIKSWDFSNNPKVPIGNMDLAPFFILGNIFGLRGVKVSIGAGSPVAKCGGLESSNAYLFGLHWIGATLAGTGHGLGQLFSRTVFLANEAKWDLTGGQGVSAMLNGGYNTFKYIAESGMLGYIAHETVAPENYQNIYDHIDLVQPGKDFSKGKERSAEENNNKWCDANSTAGGFAEQSQIANLGTKFAEALNKAAAGDEKAWAEAVKVANEQISIRDNRGPFYMKGAEEFVAGVKDLGGAAFALGAGGKGAMYAVLGPKGVTKKVRAKFDLKPITEDMARDILDNKGIMKGYIPYQIDAEGMTWSDGWERAGFGPIPSQPMEVEVEGKRE